MTTSSTPWMISWTSRRDQRRRRGRMESHPRGRARSAWPARHRWIAAGIAAAAVASTASGAAAQDEFGRMVAVAGQSVFVGKPGPSRGPAALYRFRHAGRGGWVLAAVVSPPDGAAAGHRLSPSLLWSGGTLMVGSGDPDVAIGAHFFADEGGALSHRAMLRLPALPASTPAGDRDASSPGGLPTPAVDFAGVMRILQPPSRSVALNGDLAAVSVAAGGSRPAGIHFFQRAGRGWRPASVLPPPGPESEYPAFGEALAIRRGETYAGSPFAEGSGRLYVYRAPDDARGNLVLAPDSMHQGARFGAALAVESSHLLVGAPGAETGAGRVYAYRRFEPGEWELRQVLSPGAGSEGEAASAGTGEGAAAADEAEAAAGDDPAVPSDAAGGGFGSALALLGDELWVGAPQARSGAGAVHRFRLVDGAWQPEPLEGLADGSAFAGGTDAGDAELAHAPDAGAAIGSAIALGATVAVVGAPGADGGHGAALAFTRALGGAWSGPEWIRPAPGPEAVADGEVRCEEGSASDFACEGVDLLAYLPIASIGGGPHERVSDMWGWTDPENGREYALIGRTGGAAIVEVTNPSAPRYIGVVGANPSGARDLKVYANHLFFTGDGAGDHGLVVFDLARLRALDAEAARGAGPPFEFEPDAVYRGISSAHNLVMDAESGFAFPVGASGGGETCGGGLHMVDVRDPKSPVFAGCFTDTVGLIAPGRTHDAQCVVYRGPDERYRERQVCFISNETLLRIVDITDKENPAPVGAASHPGVAYIHQGWLTDDHRYYYLDDELDELVGTAPRTRTFIYDVAELDDPLLVGSVDGPSGATDHNLYVKGDRMYQANYQAGFRLFDITDPEAPEEIGWFDTTPYEGDPPGFTGAWTAYPYFESGTVVVTSIHEGVFLLRPQPRRLIP